MTKNDGVDKVARFQAALNQLTERVAEDRYVLAIVLVGSLSPETIWHRETLGLWIIEADGVSRRLPSDGNDERVFRILVENGINIHAEVIPRSRFKKMVEGASRTAFSCNFFARRQLVYSKDPSIDTWFNQANSIATKDKERELLTFSTWTIHAHRHARKRLDVKGDLELAAQEILGAAHSVAHTEIIRQGQVWEQDVIYRAIDGDPELFQTIYLDVLAKRKNRGVLSRAAPPLDQSGPRRNEERMGWPWPAARNWAGLIPAPARRHRRSRPRWRSSRPRPRRRKAAAATTARRSSSSIRRGKPPRSPRRNRSWSWCCTFRGTLKTRASPETTPRRSV